MAVKFSNNASATLASAITSGSTTVALASGQGGLFPALTGSDFFYATLVDASNNLEVVKVTGRTGDSLTVVRGQGGTNARAFSGGDRCELRVVADAFAEILQRDGSVAMTGALNMGTNKVTNVVDPTAAQDAATKNYVDTAAVALINQEITDRTNAVSAEATARANAVTAEATARANADALLLPKTGGVMSGEISGNYYRSASTSENARATGFRLANGTDIGECDRSTQYYDDLASNCNGYLPSGNCAGDPTWTPPNGNWWTWGVSGVPTGNCANWGSYDGAGGTSSSFYAVSVGYNYDGYYEAANEIGGSEQRRNYRNCNCGSFNCRTNCNCNCACACSTDSCFLPGTMVRMADGGLKSIESVQVGDMVAGYGKGVTRVNALWRPVLGDRSMYSFGGHVVTTEDHLVMRHDGFWACLNKARFTERRYMAPATVSPEGKMLFNSTVDAKHVHQLVAGDSLLTADGDLLSVASIDKLDGLHPTTQLYSLFTECGNFVLANGVVVDGMWQGGVKQEASEETEALSVA